MRGDGNVHCLRLLSLRVDHMIYLEGIYEADYVTTSTEYDIGFTAVPNVDVNKCVCWHLHDELRVKSFSRVLVFLGLGSFFSN